MKTKDIPVLILAGGFGTRLAKVVSDVPKPMAPISGKPFLEWLLGQVKSQGFSKVTLLTGHKAHTVSDYFGDGSQLGLKISYQVEETPLGTGGAIRKAFVDQNLTEALVLNGDTLFLCDLQLFLQHSTSSISVALRYSADVARFGAVGISEDYRINTFAEKELTGDGLINGGIYYISKAALSHFPEGPCSFEKDVVEKTLDKMNILGLPLGGRFIDIGTPESFKEGQESIQKWINEPAKPCVFLDRDGILIRHKPYLSRVEDVEINPEAIELVKYCKSKGLLAVVITNQSGIARGYFSESQCQAVNTYIAERFKEAGAALGEWYLCPRLDSILRKPNPGMILQAMDRQNIDIQKSFMVGDNDTDQIRLPGLKTYLVEGDFTFSKIWPGNQKFSSLNNLVDQLKVEWSPHLG